MARETLTAKQERFAQLVVIHGTRQRIAYRKAYDACEMADITVDIEASKLMRHPKVAVRIEELRKIAEAKLEVSIENIARQLARIGFLDLRDCYDDQGRLLAPHEMPEGVAMAIDGIDVVEMEGGMKITLPAKDGKKKGGEQAEPAVMHVPMYTKKVRHSRIKALELMAKWRKMLVDQVEHGAPGEFANMDDAQLEAEHVALQVAVNAIERARNRKKVTVKAVKQG